MQYVVHPAVIIITKENISYTKQWAIYEVLQRQRWHAAHIRGRYEVLHGQVVPASTYEVLKQ